MNWFYWISHLTPSFSIYTEVYITGLTGCCCLPYHRNRKLDGAGEVSARACELATPTSQLENNLLPTHCCWKMSNPALYLRDANAMKQKQLQLWQSTAAEGPDIAFRTTEYTAPPLGNTAAKRLRMRSLQPFPVLSSLGDSVCFLS